MTPGVYKLVIYQGATLSLEMTWYDDAGDVIDLSTYSARLQVRRTKESDDVLEEMTSAAGTIILAAVSPNITKPDKGGYSSHDMAAWCL